jgi:hypothetical protein
MVVGNDDLDAAKAAPAQAEEKVAPARPVLPVGQLAERSARKAAPISADGRGTRQRG